MKFITLVSGLLVTFGFSLGMSVNNQFYGCNRCIGPNSPCHSKFLMLIKITGEHIEHVNSEFAVGDLFYRYEVIHDFNGNAQFRPESRPANKKNFCNSDPFVLGQTYLVTGGDDMYKDLFQAEHCTAYIKAWNHDPDSADWDLSIKEIEQKCHRAASPTPAGN